MLQPRAIAQTLQASYKGGYLVYSQFVPQAVRNEAGGAEHGGAEQTPHSETPPLETPPRETPPLETPPRYFSPRECARLMGFPESFLLNKDEGHAYRQLGNAVCPPVVAPLGAAVIAALLAGAALPTAGVGGGAGVRAGVRAARGAGAQMPTGLTRDSNRSLTSSRLQCWALRVALELTLAASPATRRPLACWLSPPTLSALGNHQSVVADHLSVVADRQLAVGDRQLAVATAAGHAVTAERANSEMAATSELEPAAVCAEPGASIGATSLPALPGGDYHARLTPRWVRCEIQSVLELARALEPVPGLGVEGGAEGLPALNCGPPQMAAQTLPSPVSAVKALAGREFRRFKWTCLLRDAPEPCIRIRM